MFNTVKFTQIQGYDQICNVIQTKQSFIPVIHFRKKQTKTHQLAEEYYGNQLIQSDITMIYSHGNSSDLEYCYQLIHLMIRKYPVNYIIYDYTGYGNLQCKVQKKDLRKVIKWSNVPFQNIILWGFSLGCYPSIKISTQIQVYNLILQSPFASIFHFIQSQSHEQKVFKQDLFNKLQLISKIQCDALLIHSQNDEIIPIKHSRMLLNRFNESNNQNHMRLVEISNIKHNQMNFAFCLGKRNQLQLLFERYLVEATKLGNSKKSLYIFLRHRKQQSRTKSDLISINSQQLQIMQNSHQIYFNKEDFIKQNKFLNKVNKNKVETKSTCENDDNISHQNQIWSKDFRQLNETEFYKKSRNYSFQIED